MNAAIAIVLALAAVCSGTGLVGSTYQYVPSAYSGVQYQYVQQPQYKYVQQQVVPSTQYVYKSPVQYTVPAASHAQYTVPAYYAAGSSPVVSTYGASVYNPSYVYGYGK